MATFDAITVSPVTPPASAPPTKQASPPTAQITIKQRWRVVRAT